jgi:hypothetical protein
MRNASLHAVRGIAASRPPGPRELASSLRRLLPYGIALPAALVVGLLVADQKLEVVGILVLLVGFAVLLRKRPGVAVGILVLGIANGLPGIDTIATSTAGGFALDSVLAGLLIVVLVAAPSISGIRPRRLPGWVYLWSAAFAFWWVVTLYRTIIAGVPLTAAVTQGREFLVFALAVPAAWRWLGHRRYATQCLATLGVGAVLYACGEILIVVGGVSLSWLVHPVAVRTSDVGLTRVYAYMSDLAAAGMALGVGASLLFDSRFARIVGLGATLLFGAAIVLQQGRAVYIALFVAFAIAAGAIAMATHARARLFRARVLGTAAALAVVLGFGLLLAPTAVTKYGGAPLSRLQSGLQEASTSTGNVGIRFSLYNQMFQTIDGDLPVGLGFLDQRYVYFPDLPLGSIRSSDVGLMNAVMTMGLIGLILLYIPVVYVVTRLIQRLHRAADDMGETWIAFGIAVWLLMALLSSITRTTLASLPGLTITTVLTAVTVPYIRLAEPAPSRGARRGIETRPSLTT